MWTLVVDLCPGADAGLAQRPAVDGGVGADLHVVLDDQGALLGEEDVFAGGGVAGVAKARAAQHGPGLHDNPATEGGASAQHNAAAERDVVAERDPDLHNGLRANLRPLAEGCRGMDAGGGVHAGLTRWGQRFGRKGEDVPGGVDGEDAGVCFG